MTSAATASAPGRSAGSSAWLQLTVVELKLLVRERIRFLLGVGFPVILLVIFGSIPAFRKPVAAYGGLSVLDEYVPILVVFSLALLALGFVPVTLAGYREKGILRRLRTTPAGPVRVLVAQIGASVVVAVARVVLVLLVAVLGYGVAWPRQFGGFVIYALLTLLALLALGLLVAAVAPTGGAAQTIGLTLLFPLMFFAGLWLPIPSMPPVLQDISHATPLGAAVQAMLDVSGGRWPSEQQLLVLFAYTVVCGLAAARLFRWE